MGEWTCDVCGWEYDPVLGDKAGGILPGTQFEDLPADWCCPDCGAAKHRFAPTET